MSGSSDTFSIKWQQWTQMNATIKLLRQQYSETVKKLEEAQKEIEFLKNERSSNKRDICRSRDYTVGQE